MHGFLRMSRHHLLNRQSAGIGKVPGYGRKRCNQAPPATPAGGPRLESFIAIQRAASHGLDGRSVFGWEKDLKTKEVALRVDPLARCKPSPSAARRTGPRKGDNTVRVAGRAVPSRRQPRWNPTLFGELIASSGTANDAAPSYIFRNRHGGMDRLGIARWCELKLQKWET